VGYPESPDIRLVLRRAGITAGFSGLALLIVGTAPASAALSVAVQPSTVDEGQSFTITVSDDQPSSEYRCVGWGTQPGTAAPADGDYAVSGGELCLAPGESSSLTAGPVVRDDTKPEPPEYFWIDIANARSGPTKPDQMAPQYPIAQGKEKAYVIIAKSDGGPDAKPGSLPGEKIGDEGTTAGDPALRGPNGECTNAFMESKLNPAFKADKGSQFFGLMRAAAHDFARGAIVTLPKRRAILNNVLTCDKGALSGKVELPRAGQRPLLIGSGRMKLHYAAVGRTLLHLKPTSAAVGALRGARRLKAKVTISHTDGLGATATRSYTVVLTNNVPAGR
jgi:hypothetical protein